MSKVFFSKIEKRDKTKSIGEKVKRLYQKSELGKLFNKNDFLALKIHFGEAGNAGFINPFWLRPLVGYIKESVPHLFFTDSNTLYQGERANAIDHLKIAFGHKFSLQNLGAPVIISDGLFGRNFREVAISGKYFKKVKIASSIVEADSILGLAHLTGHCQTGLAGAIKNLAMGCASRQGKLEQHSEIFPEVDIKKCLGCQECISWCPVKAIECVEGKAKIKKELCIGCGECTVVCRTEAIKIFWDDNLKRLQEKMAEYFSGVVKGKKVAFINFLTFFTKDCDCMSKDKVPLIEDIGIIASDDPVAIDKASADLLNQKKKGDIFKEIFPEIDWSIQLNYASQLGLGSLDYELIEV